MPNAHIPLEGYPPHYLMFLLASAIATTTIPMGPGEKGRNKAVSTRAAINQMRALYRRRKDDPTYKKIAHVMMSVQFKTAAGDIISEGPALKGASQVNDPSGSWILVGKVRGHDVMSNFEAAGIKPETLENDPLAGIPSIEWPAQEGDS